MYLNVLGASEKFEKSTNYLGLLKVGRVCTEKKIKDEDLPVLVVFRL